MLDAAAWCRRRCWCRSSSATDAGRAADQAHRAPEQACRPGELSRRPDRPRRTPTPRPPRCARREEEIALDPAQRRGARAGWPTTSPAPATGSRRCSACCRRGWRFAAVAARGGGGVRAAARRAARSRRAAAAARITCAGGWREFWVWPHPEHYIWGATAAILVHLAQKLRAAGPHAAAHRVRPVPVAVRRVRRLAPAGARAGGPSVRCGAAVGLRASSRWPAALFWFSRRDALPPGDAYVPAHLRGRTHRARPRARPPMTEPPALVIAPPGFLADPALAAVLAALPEARVVGGAVRDALAGRPVADIDLATPLPPEQVMRALRGGRHEARCRPGCDHGTVTAVAGGRGFEITTLRRDVETDGRHAVRRLHRRLAGGRGAARLHHQRAVDDARRRGVRLFRRDRRPARAGACASSATRRRASPRTICASCASSASTRAMARGAARAGGAGGDPRRRRRARPRCRPSGCGAS